MKIPIADNIQFHVYRQGYIIADFVIMVRCIFIDVELTASIIADCISDDFGCRVVFWHMTPGTVGYGAVEIQAIGVIG